MKEVMDGPAVAGMDVTMDRLGFENGSGRDRLTGEDALMESIDVAGEMPSETKDRRLRGYTKVSYQEAELRTTLGRIPKMMSKPT